jgi:putative transposase
LVEPIATRLQQRLLEIAEQSGFEIFANEVMRDHVHLFVSAPPEFAPAQVVRLFNGIPSRRLTQEFQHIRRADGASRAALRAEGYSVGPTGHVSAETIKLYFAAGPRDLFKD